MARIDTFSLGAVYYSLTILRATRRLQKRILKAHKLAVFLAIGHLSTYTFFASVSRPGTKNVSYSLKYGKKYPIRARTQS